MEITFAGGTAALLQPFLFPVTAGDDFRLLVLDVVMPAAHLGLAGGQFLLKAGSRLDVPCVVFHAALFAGLEFRFQLVSQMGEAG